SGDVRRGCRCRRANAHRDVQDRGGRPVPLAALRAGTAAIAGSRFGVASGGRLRGPTRDCGAVVRGCVLAGTPVRAPRVGARQTGGRKLVWALIGGTAAPFPACLIW